MHDRHDQVRDALYTWGRWARSHRGAGPGRAGSAEGLYQRERLRGDHEADRRDAGEPLDVALAMTVNERISPVRNFPVRSYLLLSAQYVYRMRGYEVVGYLRRHGQLLDKRGVDAALQAAVADAARVLGR